MSTNILPFQFGDNEVRVITDEKGDPWFVLRDVLTAMETSTPTTKAETAIEQGLGKGFTSVIPLQTSGWTQNLTIISEPAVTFLVARSNTECGRNLNRWVHVEILPQIRKTGEYAPVLSPAEQLLANAQRLVDHERQIKQIEEQQAALASKHHDLRNDVLDTKEKLADLLGGDLWMSVKGYANRYGLPGDRRYLAQVGKRATTLCKQQGIERKNIDDQQWGSVGAYPEDILAEAFAGV